MPNVLFTCPGQIGDDLFRFPIAYQYAKQRSIKIDIALWEGSKTLLSLLTDEPWVDNVFTSPGITGLPLGGQPWDFGRDAEWRTQYTHVYHLGYRRYPYPRINNTLECLETSETPINIDSLLTEPCLTKHTHKSTKNLAVHFDASCEMRNSTSFQTVAPLFDNLRDMFTTCFLLGIRFDRPQYTAIIARYGNWVVPISDSGDWNVTAKVLEECVLVGTYGSMWALMNCMKGPQVVIMDTDFIRDKGNKISFPEVERLVVVGDSTGVLNNTIELVNRG